MTTKTKIQSITFGFSESQFLGNKTVSTFKEAESLIQDAAFYVKHDGYDKTDVMLCWEDGTTYKCTVDVDKGMQGFTFESYLKPQLERVSGLHKPQSWTQEQYTVWLSIYKAETKERAVQLLENYSFTD